MTDQSPDIKIIPITGSVGNCYLILASNHAILVDTGLKGRHAKILQTLSGQGLAPAQLDLIIITHADGDHYGSLQALKAAIYTPSAASPIEAAAIRAGMSSRTLKTKGLRRLFLSLGSRIFQPPAALIDLEIGADYILPIPGWQILLTPGHTPGHISLYNPAARTLICGDSIWLSGKRLVPTSGANCWDEEAARKSFDLQAALQPIAVYGGHFTIPAGAADYFT